MEGQLLYLVRDVHAEYYSRHGVTCKALMSNI
jgi:hypothetical protein